MKEGLVGHAAVDCRLLASECDWGARREQGPLSVVKGSGAPNSKKHPVRSTATCLRGIVLSPSVGATHPSQETIDPVQCVSSTADHWFRCVRFAEGEAAARVLFHLCLFGSEIIENKNQTDLCYLNRLVGDK